MKTPLYELPSKTVIDLRQIEAISSIEEGMIEPLFGITFKSGKKIDVVGDSDELVASDRDNLLKAWQEVASNRFPVSVAPA